MTNRVFASLKKIWFLPVVIIVAALSLTSPVFSQPQALTSGLPGAEKFYSPETLATYYTNRELRPIWVRGNGSFQPRVAAVIGILEDSWTHGLNPEHYRLTEIKDLLTTMNAENRLQLDLVVSDAVIRYARDLTGQRGRSADRKITYWREPLDPPQILQMVSETMDPVGKVRSIEPGNALYHALRTELMRLAVLPSEKGAKPISGGIAFKPGKSYKQMPQVRARMGQPEAANDPQLYDEALAVEIMRLQKSYGLETNGVIDARTLSLINMTNEDKIYQIIANMERLRWIDQGRPDKYILVNIPSASLWAVENGDVKLEMPVIVGKTARPTYSFKTEITGVRFNPNWTVPPTIKNVDFLPALQQDPTTLARHGIRLRYQGRDIDPMRVDWKTVTTRDLTQVKMIQDPGENNPLGKVRVIMENPYNIYLHDTNHRDLFEKDERNLSSGCIRVSQPEKLADFILNQNGGWDWTKMEKMIDSGRMRDVPTEKPIPVFITYQTVWLDSEGRLVYGRDVYGQDRILANMLKKAGAIHLPQPAEKSDISL